MRNGPTGACREAHTLVKGGSDLSLNWYAAAVVLGAVLIDMS